MANGGTLDLTTGLVLFLLAMVPPILYVVWIRNTERFQREPWKSVFWLFAWGMVFAILIAVILESLFVGVGEALQREYVRLGDALRESPNLRIILLAVVIAPVMEEFAKGLGVYSVRRQISEEEDGLVYGSAAGLGFAATENLFYGLYAFALGGFVTSLAVIAVRSFSSALLHASASSVFGLGVARRQIFQARVLPYYIMAVAMHAAFNFLASFDALFRDAYGEWASLFGFVAAILFALSATALVRGTIRRRDQATGPIY
jgi:RsiW-degrading membrane proteinase PrsW (M82 family)